MGKLTKTLLLGLCGALVLLSLGHLTNFKKLPLKSFLEYRENKSSKVKYEFKLKTGIVTIFADKLVFKKNKNIVVSNIAIKFVSPKKELSITAKEGIYDPSLNKVSLAKNILITSQEFQLQTEKAEIDIAKQEFVSNSKTIGKIKNLNFQSEKITINNQGEIQLTEMKSYGKK